jgi:hypothetical protein
MKKIIGLFYFPYLAVKQMKKIVAPTGLVTKLAQFVSAKIEASEIG